MRGKQAIKIANNRVRYSFELTRNITVVQGNSGTGKTTLFDMVSAYARLQEKSGVQVQCDKKCVALRADSDWRSVLERTEDSIVFIDEDADYVDSEVFAASLKSSDNYYVIFSREAMHNLPYSVEEIYEIKTSGKYHTFQKRYKVQKGCLYAKATGGKKVDAVLTEDSHAGLEFYRHLYEDTNVQCETSSGNAGLFAWLMQHINEHEKVFVVADGAAIGSEMGKLMTLQHQYADKITLCMPESFEWLILQSGVIDTPNLQEMLANPSEAIESKQYFSWENYFTEYLVQHTVGTHYAYTKAHLQAFYAVRENSKRIVALIAVAMPKTK